MLDTTGEVWYAVWCVCGEWKGMVIVARIEVFHGEDCDADGDCV